MNLTQRAKQIINETLYLSLATSFNNETWVSPLWFAVDKDLNFYFVSEFGSKHATFIKQNPNVAFSVFNSAEKPEDVNGLQISAKAYEVLLTEVPHALQTIFQKEGADLFKLRFKDWNNPKTYLNLSKFRIYKLVPDHFWILDTEVIETDKRVELTKSSLLQG